MSLPARQRAVQLVGPDQLTLNVSKAVPAPGPHEFLCEVVTVGLCFSDLKLLKQFSGHVRKSAVVSGIPPEVLQGFRGYVPDDRPTVPGHEPVVRIAAVGSGVERFKVGERYFIQADWRWLKTAGSNGAFGYNFEGALQEYVLLDERLVTSPEGESMLLPAPEGPRSAAAFGLVEPWACVEFSYRARDRAEFKTGGRMLIVADATPEPAVLRDLFMHHARPLQTLWVSSAPAPAWIPIPVETASSPDAVPDEAFDDVLYFGHDPATASRLFSKAAKGGLILLMLGGARFGRPVETALGGIHYRGLRLAATVTADPADALAVIPADGEIRPGETVHIIGAGGPMGVMHVIRDLCLGLKDLTVVAADLSDERLAILARLAESAARKHGARYEAYNSSAGTRPGPFHYQVVMAPVPALVAAAVTAAAPGGRINIFAGIPVEKSGPVDLDAYAEKGLYLIGTSGSELEDMRIVLGKVESGAVDTNVSVAAIAGLEGAVDGIRAVERQAVPGKILVYPACRGLGLTQLDELAARLPDVAARLAPGPVWTREAEAALLAHHTR